jgi:hypothetical protein
MRNVCFLTTLIVSLGLAGCTNNAGADKAGNSKKSEDDIKQSFTALQAAIKAKDGDKVWTMMSKDAQEDAERQAKAIKEAHTKMSDKEKEEYEKKIAVSVKDLTSFDGKGYVRSKSFFTGEVAEIPDSKFDKVAMSSKDAGTLHYIEDDGKGDKERMSVLREQDQWRFTLNVPKAVLK